MRFHGRRRKVEGPGDLLVGLTHGHGAQDLGLARRQVHGAKRRAGALPRLAARVHDLDQSAIGPSPDKYGSFLLVQCVGCGGHLGGGSISTDDDYFGAGAATSVPWEGANPGNFTLSSTFLAGAPNNGRLQLRALGGGGASAYDFSIALRSITTHGPAHGLSIYIADTGQRIGVSSAGAVPEPASWALMIAGFGMAGGMMRRHARPVGAA